MSLRNDASTSKLFLNLRNDDDNKINNKRIRTSTGNYSISSLLPSTTSSSSLLYIPSLSQNPYIPTSLSSLTPSFTSRGNLPQSTTSTPVTQRRSQAPLINLDPSTQGRKVLDTEFESYLSSIAEGWDRWEKERRLGRRGRADLGALQDERRESLFHYERSRSNDQKRDQKEKTEHEEREEEVLPALEDVPAIFFEEGFNLSNPRTFDLVTEKILETPRGSPIVARKRLDFGHISNSVSSTDDAISTSTPASPSSRPGLGPLTLADLATDSLLQEKLSHYTAIVESHLVKEIGLRSSSFFSALENLQGLQDKGEECLAKIEGLSHLLDGSNSSHSDVTAAASMSRGGIGQGAMRGLKILRFQARRRGLDQIDRSVVEVEEIWRGIEAVQQLIEASEWIAALEVGEAVEQRYLGQHGSASRGINYKVEELDRSREGSIDLMRIKALNHIPSKINSLRHQISQALQSELMGILGREMDASVDQYVKLSSRSQSSEKRQHGTTRSHPTTIISTENQVGSAELNEGKIVARERVIESIDLVIKGLVRADGIDAAVLAWKEVILRDVRSRVKECLPSSAMTNSTKENEAGLNTTSLADKSLGLASSLKELSHVEFMTLSRNTYAGLLGSLEVVDVHAQVILELVNIERAESSSEIPLINSRIIAPMDSNLDKILEEELNEYAMPPSGAPVPTLLSNPAHSVSNVRTVNNPPITGPDEDLSLASDLSDVLYSAAELAHLRFSKIISVRTPIHNSLPFVSFLEIFDVSWEFLSKCEIKVKRMIVPLRSMMIFQSKTWLSEFHSRETDKMARGVEEEIWVGKDVDEGVQRIVRLLVECAVRDPEEFLLGTRRAGTLEGKKVGGSAPVKDATKQLDIEGKDYFAVAAGLHTLEVLSSYLKIAMNFPLLITETMSRIVEYMKSFNSRTCQVVLGAGAMRSAGLKNITAKHLALASQALSIMIALIPYIREAFRRYLNPKQAVMLIEFDKLKRDYQEHQNEIHSKLISIMGDRLQIHSKALQSIDFELESPRPDPSLPNMYMEALVKEHSTLYKVLSRFLHPSTVEYIMAQVFTGLNTRLREEFNSIEIRTEDARVRITRDLSWMRTRLEELKGLENLRKPGEDIERLIASKDLLVPGAPHPLPPSPPSLSSPPPSSSKPSLPPPPPTRSSPPPSAFSPVTLPSSGVMSDVEPASSTPAPYVSRRALLATSSTTTTTPADVTAPTTVAHHPSESSSSAFSTSAALSSVSAGSSEALLAAASTVVPVDALSVAVDYVEAAGASVVAASPIQRKSMAERLSEVAQRRSASRHDAPETSYANLVEVSEVVSTRDDDVSSSDKIDTSSNGGSSELAYGDIAEEHAEETEAIEKETTEGESEANR